MRDGRVHLARAAQGASTLVIAMIGGLVVSMALSLVVTPGDEFIDAARNGCKTE